MYIASRASVLPSRWPRRMCGQQERHPRHVLHAAGQHDLGVAERDLLRAQLDRLHARPAGDVHVVGADLHRHTGADRNLAAGVRTVARLARVAHDRLVDLFGLDVGATHRLDRRDRAELDGGGLGEGAQELPDRRACAFEDDRRVHPASLPAGRDPERASGRERPRPRPRLGVLGRPDLAEEPSELRATVDRLATAAARRPAPAPDCVDPGADHGELVGPFARSRRADRLRRRGPPPARTSDPPASSRRRHRRPRARVVLR